MRGTAFFCDSIGFRLRITPAHAGNRDSRPNNLMADEDHPRTCGEQLILSEKDFDDWGSPPHMRGTDGQDWGQVGSDRITPAHAGNRL